MNYIYYFVVAAAVFAIIDLVWLGYIAKSFYRKQLGSLFVKKVVTGPAIAFYTLYIVGLLFFALRPALDNDSGATALLYGGLFGLIAYATYDLTNWATLKNWPPKLAVVDIVWGAFLTAVTTYITFIVAQSLM